METLYLVLVILYIILCVALTAIVLKQEGKNAGFGALSGSTETYWSKNKNRSAEGKLVLLTRVLAAVFIILSVVLALKVWPHK
ncbi:MAG: preprotein translocase subunit SecG [Lachnospiraceae bacterium]|nr:preprotein translocase subunit SecG [Lachnospiraceae bacterium]